MSAHTPGPWFTSSRGAYVMTATGNIAKLCDHRDGGRKANAALIAAAPDLLEALEMALEDPDSEILGTLWESLALAAIAKATGAQP